MFSGANTTEGLWECDVQVSDGTDTNNASSNIEVEVDWAGAVEFTNCGQTGHTGPSQSQCDGAYAGTTLEGGVTVSSGIQIWTVPSTGTYVIEAIGAAGNNGTSTAVGYGAQMSGEFVLTEGTELQILVGYFPESNGSNGAGGGGSFVTQSPHTSQSDILVIAGGGGGDTSGGYNSASNATTSTTAGSSQTGCSGGSNGNGGDVCGYSGSRKLKRQGGGFFTNGGVTDCGSIGSNEVARSLHQWWSRWCRFLWTLTLRWLRWRRWDWLRVVLAEAVATPVVVEAYANGYAGGGASYNNGQNQSNCRVDLGNGSVTIDNCN